VKLSFEKVLAQSEKILMSVILHPSFNSEDDYYDEYIIYLNDCGWNEKEFDQELLKMIDNEFVTMWRRANFSLIKNAKM
jgi:hypothetical protein